MRYCKWCVNPDTRPNISFDSNGVCLPCRFTKERKQGLVDWAARRRELEELADWGRRTRKSHYDCMVPVSGGKDSTRQALYVRDELKLNPLLVSCVYPPEQQAERGAHNLSNLVALGFDTIAVSLNPQVWKELMRVAWVKYGNWCRSTELALYSIPIHVAIAYHIPLIFLGENPSFTTGESEGSLTGDANRMKYCNTLKGGTTKDLRYDGLTMTDVHFYEYPSDEEIDRAQLRIVYLGYYIENFNGFDNAEFAVRHGLELRTDPPGETGEMTGYQSLDEDFVIVNQMLKYLKYGFGATTDKVCEAINLGRLSREEGIELVKRYDGKCGDKYIQKFCSYLGLSEERFWELAEQFRNHDIWTKDAQGRWKLKVELV